MIKQLLLIAMALLMPAETLVYAGSNDSPPCVVTKRSGRVTIQKLGSDSGPEIVDGSYVNVSDKLTTDQNGRVQLTLSDGAYLDLAGNTSIRVLQYSYDRKTNRRSTRIRVLKGSIRAVLYEDLSKDSLFYLETDHAAIVPSQQAMVVLYSSDSETDVAVLRGSARVKNSRPYVVGEVSVGMGQRTIVRAGTTPHFPAILESSRRKNIAALFEY